VISSCLFSPLSPHKHEGKCTRPFTISLSILTTPQFGKQIHAQQVPGWSQYYLDYKFLKKIISSLAANRPASEAAALALGVRPSDPTLIQSSLQHASQTMRRSPASSPAESPGQPPIFEGSRHGLDRDLGFRAHKAAFFFKLERELEKVKLYLGFSRSNNLT
jgi:CDK inhibitor PHO81